MNGSPDIRRRGAGRHRGRQGGLALHRLVSPALEKPDVARKLRAIAAGYTGWHFQNKNPAQFLEPVANDRLEEILAPTLVVVQGELDLDFYNLPMAEVLSEAYQIISSGGSSALRRVICPTWRTRRCSTKRVVLSYIC